MSSYTSISSITLGDKMNTLIKNVDEEKWHFLKVEAAKEKVALGELFNRIVEEYKNRKRASNERWEKIFSAKPILTEKEAKEMHKASESFRNEYSFEG